MLKLILPPLFQEEILAVSESHSKNSMFWGGMLGESESKIQEIIALPPLHERNIEEILSEQPHSFDVIIASGVMSASLKKIREFCHDTGLYFYHFLPPTASEKPSRSSSIKNAKAPNIPISKSDPLKDKEQSLMAPEKPPRSSSKKNTKAPNTPISKSDQTQEIEIPLKPEDPTSIPKNLTPGTLIETQKLRKIFTHISDFSLHRRGQQINMIRMILDAFQDYSHLIVEATTGTGKSLAYLLPSILLAEQTKERILIAPHTKMLQTQLLEKEVPMALSLLDSSISVKVAKGKSNYLCLRRFFDYQSTVAGKKEDLFGSAKDFQKRLKILENWFSKTPNGDLDSLPGDARLFRKDICVQTEFCDKKTCPHLSRCFYFKEWEKLEKASIIIINHALLLSQMDFEYRGIEYELIPPATRLIIDEAHHFPDNAMREFSFSSSSFSSILEPFSPSKDGKRTFLISKVLREIDSQDSQKETLKYLEDLPKFSGHFSEVIAIFFQQLPPIFLENSVIRVTENQNPFLPLQGFWEQVKEKSIPLLYALRTIHQGLQKTPQDFQEEHIIIIQQLNLAMVQLEYGLGLWDSLFREIAISFALWVEAHSSSYTLHAVDMQNEQFLQQTLWKNYHSVILTSATLSHQSSLSEIQKKLHIPASVEFKKAILPPIFDYSTQAKFFVPSDIPPPTSENFLQSSTSIISELIQATSSGVLILATSIKQMNDIFVFLSRLNLNRPLFFQGQKPIENILDDAKQKQNCIILGVDSFWEGIDLPGKALELLIILKLPFSQIGNPRVETLCDMAKAAGHSPFHQVLLTNATTKLQQGIGRLLRTPKDRGVIVCLDNRLFEKSYGKQISNSLYIHPQFLPTQALISETKQFLAHPSE